MGFGDNNNSGTSGVFGGGTSAESTGFAKILEVVKNFGGGNQSGGFGGGNKNGGFSSGGFGSGGGNGGFGGGSREGGERRERNDSATIFVGTGFITKI